MVVELAGYLDAAVWTFDGKKAQNMSDITIAPPAEKPVYSYIAGNGEE